MQAVFAACQAASAQDVKSLRAKAIAEPIELDGSLNDPQWRDVQAATGAPASEATEVKVAYRPKGGGDNWGVLRVRRGAVPTVLTLRA